MTRSPYFKLRSDGTIRVKLPDEVRSTLVLLAKDLEKTLETEDKDLTRLFPTAYPHDPTKDAGYQIFSKDQLIQSRREQIEVLTETAEASSVTEEQLSAWMKVVNDIRLVIGTRLDMTEDMSLMTFDPTAYENPEAALQDLALYEGLGELLHFIVEALTGALESE